MNVAALMELSQDQHRRATGYQTLVRNYYEHVTDFYRWGWGDHFHFAPFLGSEPVSRALEAQQDLLVREAGIGPGLRALDVGCGVGGPACHIARTTGARVTGITISPTQVRIARRLFRRAGLERRCEVVLGDAMQMSFDSQSFDVVYAIESACHMPNKEHFFAECARVLADGGTLAGWDWVRCSGSDAERFTDPICRYFVLPSLCTLEQIGEHLRHAGLEVLTLEDLAHRSNVARPWWQPLERRLASRLSWLAVQFSPTLRMMRSSGERLVAAGKAGAFSPLGFFVARKPAAADRRCPSR